MNRRQPLVALRALRNLINDPERTDEVFVITSSLSGDSIQRGHTRFAATPLGRNVLDTRRALLDRLTDRAALARLPEGSLGRAYLHFVETNNIAADGLVEASEAGENDASRKNAYGELNEEQIHYACRLRDMHDLWHVVTGYSTQPFGEVCVVTFSYPQTGNLGLGVIGLIGALKVARGYPLRAVLSAAWQAYRNGRRAAWLPAADWEALLAQPLAAVRAQLKLTPPTQFQKLTNYYADWGQSDWDAGAQPA